MIRKGDSQNFNTDEQLTAATATLTKILRSELSASSLELRLSSLWNSSNKDHRQQIRAALSTETEQDLSSLENRPNPPGYQLSISHCPAAGGFILIGDFSGTLGFDLEQTSRAEARIVQRVSTPEEMHKAPHPALLWCAKEAGFKGESHRPGMTVISQVRCRDWREFSLKTECEKPESSASSTKDLRLFECKIDVHPNSQPQGATRESHQSAGKCLVFQVLELTGAIYWRLI
jgi:hypothetical protein